MEKTDNEVKRKENQISLRDKIVLGPIDRYKKYNHFPWKMLIHVILVFITSFQVLTLNRLDTDVSFHQEQLFLKMFMTKPWGDESTVTSG